MVLAGLVFASAQAAAQTAPAPEYFDCMGVYYVTGPTPSVEATPQEAHPAGTKSIGHGRVAPAHAEAAAFGSLEANSSEPADKSH